MRGCWGEGGGGGVEWGWGREGGGVYTVVKHNKAEAPNFDFFLVCGLFLQK